MEPLPPIPISARQRWRELRVSYLPLLTFLLLVVTIIWMWKRYVYPPSVVGEVEAVRASVVSVVSGTIQELKADYLQAVTNGQELVVLSVLDPDKLTAELAAVEADLRLMKARMDLDKTRNLASYDQLRTQLLVEQLKLELARINLRQADSEFERAQKMFDTRLTQRGVSERGNDFGYDVALRDRDARRAEVAAGEKTVAQLEANAQRMQATGVVQVDPVDAVIEQAISAQSERLRRLQGQVVLRSPLDGFVSARNNRPGEKVIAGRPILVISAAKSDRIVGWIRQPVTVRPQVGDLVEVRRAMFGEAPFQGTIAVVGAQLEPISPMAFWPNVSAPAGEVGLPIIITSPKTIELIPGESIQIHLAKQRGRGAK